VRSEALQAALLGGVGFGLFQTLGLLEGGRCVLRGGALLVLGVDLVGSRLCRQRHLPAFATMLNGLFYLPKTGR